MKASALLVAAVLASVAIGPDAQGQSSPESNRLRIGIATADITPPLGYPMSGYYRPRGADGVLDPLHAKAIVMDDGTTKAALVVCDLIGIATDVCTLVRRKAAHATGIPGAHIMVTATHSHTGPDYYLDLRAMIEGTEKKSSQSNYAADLIEKIAKAIKQADQNLSTGSMLVGSGKEQSVSFNRRFVMRDGSIRTWANYRDPDTVRAAGPIDPSLGMLLINDQEGQPIGGLSVFALHLDTTGGTKFSADYPYHMERALKARLGTGFTSLFAAGTCGDINHVNPRSRDRNPPHVIGSRLAEAFLDAQKSLVEVEASIRVASRTELLKVKPCTTEQLRWADQIISRDQAEESLPFLDEVEAYNLRLLSFLHQGGKRDEAAAVKASPSLGGVGDNLPVEIQVLQVGKETAVVGLPGEVFVELGLAIKQASPYRHTLVVELANSDEVGYVPTELAFLGGGYETVNSAIQPGGGEQLVKAAVRLLRDIKAAAQ